MGDATPADLAAVVAWATVRVWEETSHDRPPLKSIPSLRPRVDNDTIPIRMMTADTPNHHRRLPMKSNDVWPRYRRRKTFGRLAPAATASASSAANSSSSSKASSSSSAASSAGS